MENSSIEWTNHTFNPWIGCSKVSAGCKNCYAEFDMDNRRKRVVWGVNGTRSVTAYTYWREALKWNRDAEIAGERRRVFCASLADIFEDFKGHVLDSKRQTLWWNDTLCPSALGLAHVCNDISGRPNFGGEKYCDVDGIPTFSHWNEVYLANNVQKFYNWKPLTLDIIREYLFRLIIMTPNLDWLLLTKRPENIMRMVPDYWQLKFPDNVWLGTSVEDQETADIRIRHLNSMPARVKFLSVEPQIGPVNLNKALEDTLKYHAVGLKNCISWVINGGESGHNKRPYDTNWGRSLRDECAADNIPFFFKQVDKVIKPPEDLLMRQFPA